MLTQTINAAMHRATYEILPDSAFYGAIPGFQGVCANATTLEERREPRTATRNARRMDHPVSTARPLSAGRR